MKKTLRSAPLRSAPLCCLLLISACGASETGEADGVSRVAWNASTASRFPNAIAGEELVAVEGEADSRPAYRLTGSVNELPKERLGVVVGAYGNANGSGRYTWVVDAEPRVEADSKGDLAAEPALPEPVVSEGLLRHADQAGEVDVIIQLRDDLLTSLETKEFEDVTRLDATPELGHLAERRTALVEMREAEAREAQAGLVAWLAERGAAAEGFWLVNAVSTRVSAKVLAELSDNPAVKKVAFNTQYSWTWNGVHIKVNTGLNDELYVAGNWSGERTNPVSGLHLSLAVMDTYFNDTHPVFNDGSWTPSSRLRSKWNCANSPCTSGLPAPGTNDLHGSWCASAAAADARDNQIVSAPLYQIAVSGAAEEGELIFVSTTNSASTIRGLQKAVALKADVVSQSRGGFDAANPACDGADSGWEVAVYAAHLAGTLMVDSAGNDGAVPVRPGTCQLTGLAEAPSGLVVGAVDDPGTNPYSGATRWPGSSPGGMDVTVNGTWRVRAFSQVGLMAPQPWEAAADTGSTFVSRGGTSLAAPQVAGSAVLFKDWMIARGWGVYASSPGVIFANMLAMGDRANSNTTYRDSGFSATWGAGRFQARLFEGSDHPGWPWGWENATYTMSHNQTIVHLVGGAGNEPAGIQQFKAYAVFFEQDGTNVADIDVRVYDKGCGAGKVLLGSDVSYDYKSMVRLGPTAAGKDLCVELKAPHVPVGETRQVVLINYFSNDTSMR